MEFQPPLRHHLKYYFQRRVETVTVHVEVSRTLSAESPRGGLPAAIAASAGPFRLLQSD